MTRIKRLKASLTQFPDIAVPSGWLLASEPRVFWEYMAGVTMLGVVKRIAPRGDGHPVLVIPGLGASDLSTALLRRFLDDLGYTTYPWAQGRNRGLKDHITSAMLARMQQIHGSHQQKVSIIGQSLGGVFARELAKAAPQAVRQVITLGSPFTGHPLASTGTRLYEWLSGDNLEDMDFSQHLEIRIKPPVPTTSVYSKLDGVVAWQCSIEDEQPEGENIHLRGNTHCGMASSPSALYLLAERLAQPEKHWKTFKPKGLGRVFYGTKDHAP
ncbi:MAG: alpha/beta hydrolase [Burkholderiales bacterium]|nr:alpha/beta hydrolase [Burkholderiales bacterium]